MRPPEGICLVIVGSWKFKEAGNTYQHVTIGMLKHSSNNIEKKKKIILPFIVPILSNCEQTTVIFFDVVLKNAKISSSTAKNSLRILNEKFINTSETLRWILVFPEALEYFTEVSKGSRIVNPLLSIVKPRTFAFISMVSPFKTSLETTRAHRMSLFHYISLSSSIHNMESKANMA